MSQLIQVHSLSLPELDIYTKYNETQLKHYYEPAPGIFIAESPNVIQRALHGGYEPISFLMDASIDYDKLGNIADSYDVPVYLVDTEVFHQMMGYPMTRGILCAMRRRELPSVEVLCRQLEDAASPLRRIVILENVMNPTNVGGIIRSAAALHMDAVLLTPGCADPLYRRAARVSVGTVFQIPWTYLPNNWETDGISLLHSLGFKTAAMALSDDSVSIDDKALCQEERLAIILGTEGEGLKDCTIAGSDYTVKIPMSHEVDSLNVAAASAVAFWQLGRKPTFT